MENEIPNFDFLVRLGRENPEGFEAYRRQRLQQAVATASSRNRPALEELLIVIETCRMCARTPMEAAVGAFQLMQQSVSQLQDAWQFGLEAIAQMQSNSLAQRMRTV